MDFYGDDFYADIRGKLSLAEEAAYMRLCWATFQSGVLPNNNQVLAGIAGCSRDRWARMRPNIDPFFEISRAKYAQKRALFEREKALKTRAKNAHSAAARWNKNNEIDDNLPVEAHAIMQSPPSPSPSQHTASHPSREGFEARVDTHAPGSANGVLHKNFVKSEEVTDGRPERTRLHPDWSPSLADCQFAAARGWDERRIGDEAERFRDYNTGHGTLASDWAALWRLWVQRADSDYAPRQGNGGAGKTSPLAAALARRINLAGGGGDL